MAKKTYKVVSNILMNKKFYEAGDEIDLDEAHAKSLSMRHAVTLLDDEKPGKKAAGKPDPKAAGKPDPKAAGKPDPTDNEKVETKAKEKAAGSF